MRLGRRLAVVERVVGSPDCRRPGDLRRRTGAAPPGVLGDYATDHEQHDCEDCGYSVPYNYFATCPLCGGHVGYYAYFLKHPRIGL